MVTWQSMDSAPKDGTEILGVYAWGKNSGFDFSVIRWDGQSWTGLCDGDLSIAAQGDGYTDYHEPFCTHWMHLPEPPRG